MFHVEQSNRLERLAEKLAGYLGQDASPPLVPEIVAVPNRGMARWLSFELADRLGICASVAFPTPNELLFDCFRLVLPDVPKGAAAGPDVTTWAIEAILRGRLDEETFGPVSAYVRPGGKADPISDLRLHELSRKLAEVFEQYPLYRPEWVRKWDEGECAIRGEDALEQGRASDDLRADEKWQAELWRQLGKALPDTRWHFARLSKDFSAALKQAGSAKKLDSLPRRVFFFGTTSLAPSVIDALRDLGRHLDVRLFLLNPSRQLWSDIRSRREIARDKSGLAPVEGHRLLASLGTHVRELHEMLVDEGDGFDPDSPDFEDPGTDTLLRAIQSDILDVVQAKDRVLLSEDDSVRLHVCHGPMREVEVLHDQLLAMFEADATLRPRDVVVLAPDIEAYAPAVQAVFADRKRTSADPPPLPFTIADRSLVSEQPVVSTFFDLLEIAGGRFEAGSVLDLLECNALRRRIGLDDTAGDV
ncbi:MAG: exodeoxyribonuclease V subunit gamma, partial [Alphaproteobacteria bacterium]